MHNKDLGHYSFIFIFLFNHKARDNTNKKITIYYVVWTRLTTVGCFNWWPTINEWEMQIKTMYFVHFKHKNDDESGKRQGGGEGG